MPFSTNDTFTSRIENFDIATDVHITYAKDFLEYLTAGLPNVDSVGNIIDSINKILPSFANNIDAYYDIMMTYLTNLYSVMTPDDRYSDYSDLDILFHNLKQFTGQTQEDFQKFSPQMEALYQSYKTLRTPEERKKFADDNGIRDPDVIASFERRMVNETHYSKYGGPEGRTSTMVPTPIDPNDRPVFMPVKELSEVQTKITDTVIQEFLNSINDHNETPENAAKYAITVMDRLFGKYGLGISEQRVIYDRVSQYMTQYHMKNQNKTNQPSSEVLDSIQNTLPLAVQQFENVDDSGLSQAIPRLNPDNTVSIGEEAKEEPVDLIESKIIFCRFRHKYF